ncbi:MAG: hypothetical protein ABI832_16665 [bacterium]
MPTKIIWAILGGVVVGGALGTLTGNTAITIAVCIAVAAIGVGIVDYLSRRKPDDRP